MSGERWTKTTCPYCGVGCGVLARPKADGTADIKGDPDHPANFGRLCSKGSALGETLSLEGRLLAPQIGGRAASWDEALDLVANRFRDTVADFGPDSVAMYVSGQILTEDYYVANKLMKGFIGTANIDTNSRLCMASSVAGHKRAFGSDTVPGTYRDLEEADLVVLVGSNLAWCHPVLFQRLAAAKEARGARIVVIDPRRTMTCEIADLHLAIAPGTDVALFNGLFASLGYAGAFDREYVVNHTAGLDVALAVAGRLEIDDVAKITGLTHAELYDFYQMFADTERVVTVYSQGVNQSSAGTDKVNAIINCHLATGRIGRPGMGPFSVTGQPNAMGGREAGGLANMLAAHMDIENEAHRAIVADFWQSERLPESPGLKAVDLFRAVAAGEIKALWIVATNPVDSLPDADFVRRALEVCPFVVVSDVVECTDTTAHADVLLPAAAWGEKDGTVTNSERRISRQRAFLDTPGVARPDWWQFAEVARRLGYGAAFAYHSPRDIFAEYAALTGYRNEGRRDLDISAYAEIDAQAYDVLAPFQWPQAGGHNQTVGQDIEEKRFFAEGDFFTPDRRARFVSTPYRPAVMQPERAYPLVLNTGRIRDQWHTMTRTAKTPRLLSHISEPFVEVHPDDALVLGMQPAAIAEISSPLGNVLARVAVSEQQRRGTVFMPMHWNDQLARHARVGSIIAANMDPVSGQPELKFTPVKLTRFAAAWFGFAVMRGRPRIAQFDYAALAPTRNGMRMEFADLAEPASWRELAERMLDPEENGGVELIAYEDRRRGDWRFAAFEKNRCVGLFFASRDPVAVSRSWAADQLGDALAPEQRLRLLAGRAGNGVVDRGPIVCSCFDVGASEITDAVASGHCRNVAEVGAILKAGTNCGSCRTEVMRIVAAARAATSLVEA